MAWNNLVDRMTRTSLKTFSDTDDVGSVVPIIYTRGAVSVPISEAVFDANFQSVDPETGAPITSTNPMLGVMLSDLPDGEARKGDVVVRGGVTYKVIEQQPDSEGHAKLVLKKS